MAARPTSRIGPPSSATRVVVPSEADAAAPRPRYTATANTSAPNPDTESTVARDGPANAPAVLVVSSACHGLEGFCGSGVQVALLGDAAWHEDECTGPADGGCFT